MVYTTTRYHCGQCGKVHHDYDEARSCEIEHIVSKSVESTKVAMAAAFAGVGKMRAARPASPTPEKTHGEDR